jgi:hypothetical protein
VLERLCSSRDGNEVANRAALNLKKLKKYGVIQVDEQLYWKNPNYILNYALQASSNCLVSELDKEILARYEKGPDGSEEDDEEEWQEIEAFLSSS